MKLRHGSIALISLLLMACSNSRQAAELADEAPSAEAMRAIGAMGGAAEDGGAAGAAGVAGVAGVAVFAASQPDRYLIKNATLLIEAHDARVAANSIMDAVQALQGFVANLQETVSGLGHRTITLQVRVPATAFDQSMTQLETLGKVLNKHVTTQDVTEKYLDTDARMRNLKRTEERLLDHLSRAGALEDVLRVEKELTRVREQIEQLEGRLRFLTDRVSFSTIHVTIQESPKAEPLVPAESFSTAKTTTEAVRSLVEFGRGLWVIAIWIGVWSAVWLPLIIVLIVAARHWAGKSR